MSDFEATRMMGATMQMPTGGADAMRTQMGGVATCPICQANTPIMETYCGECGFLLTSTPVADTELLPQEAALAELVDVANGRRYRLKNGQNTVGRAGTDILVDEGTVSRNHARLMLEGDTLTVEDLGSSNGTKVGDMRLAAGQIGTATHGTPLRFGNWRLMLEIAANGMSGSNADKTIVTASSPPAVSEDRTLLQMPMEPTAVVAGDPFSEVKAPEISESPSDAQVEAMPVSGEVETPEAGEARDIVAQLQRDSGPADTIDLVEGVVTIGRKTGNTIVVPQDTFVSGRHAELVTGPTGTYLTDLGSTNGTVVNGQKMTANEKQLLLEGDEVQIGQSRFTFRFFVSETDAETENESERMDYEGDPQAAIIRDALTGAGGTGN